MELEGVSLPFFHEHIMMPWNDQRKGDCCGRVDIICDGYYCKICDFFVHKKCGDSPEHIEYPSLCSHTLKLRREYNTCVLCGEFNYNLYYRCKKCDLGVHLFCVRHPPPEVIDYSETHYHKLTHLKTTTYFDCDAKCGKRGLGFPYKCHDCDVFFHMECVWNLNLQEPKFQSEVNYIHHPLHPLKLYTGQPPDYTDGKCSLCRRKISYRFFYHCSACKFSLDMSCVLNPPLQSVQNLKAHDHQLTLLPRVDTFTCNACGLHGDQSPYICVQCGFMIHHDCLDLPRLININRHDDRVSRTSVLGVLNSICGICRKKVDWKWGGYTCKSCPQYVVHSKCAIRKDVWNGKELEGIPEETEDIAPYRVIDDDTIQHFSHEKHYLKFRVNGLLWEENKRCNACIHPIGLQSFYSCINCDFFLHRNCAESVRMKRHVLHNDRLTLLTSMSSFFDCIACKRMSNGFAYQCGDVKIDVLCGAISEPFVHPSHPHHSLYYITPGEDTQCHGCHCNTSTNYVLTCIESGCGFVICFNCATLPQVAKHIVDDQPLLLWYGEKASDKYWCEICEKEMNPEKWFYTCKDHKASLHTKCVMGDFSGLMPRSTTKDEHKSYEVMLNNSLSRPFCRECNSRCMYPITLKILGTSNPYICSLQCMGQMLVKHFVHKAALKFVSTA